MSGKQRCCQPLKPSGDVVLVAGMAPCAFVCAGKLQIKVDLCVFKTVDLEALNGAVSTWVMYPQGYQAMIEAAQSEGVTVWASGSPDSRVANPEV